MFEMRLSFGSRKNPSSVVKITEVKENGSFAKTLVNIADRDTDDLSLSDGFYLINGVSPNQDEFNNEYVAVKNGEITRYMEKEEIVALLNAPAEEVEVIEEVAAEETIEDVKAEGRKLTKEVYEAAKCKETKAWSDHYITSVFTFGSDMAEMKLLRDKLKNNKQDIINQFKKTYNLN